MPNLQGVWSLVSQYQAIGNNNWADPLVGDIGLFARSATSTAIDFINIASDGNGEDFGNHSSDQGTTAVCGSKTRALFRIEYISSASNVIESCEIHTKGNTTDFGDVSSDLAGAVASTSLSNNTRGIFAGGAESSTGDHDQIEYVTIANKGNTTDFGNLSVARDAFGTLSSTTRGVFSMGRAASGDYAANVMDYITIGSTGNASDFGDLSVVRTQSDGASSSTRGLFMGGYNSSTSSSTSSRLNTIDYITIASTGNASDFGDLSSQGTGGGTSNGTKAVFAFGVEHGFSGDSADTNTIDKVTIASTGNASDFGDTVNADGTIVRGTSDSHGGIIMSTKHFAANVISASKIVPDGSFIGSSASGVWTLDEHYDLIKGDNWPRQENGPAPRGFQFGGFDGNNNLDRIDVYDLTTTGNSTDFGNMTESIRFGTATGSSSRIVRFGGTASSNANRTHIKYITAATNGDEQAFGDLSAQHEQGGALSNDTRGVAGGGNWSGDANSTIEYVTIASTGDSTNFGDLSAGRTSLTGCASTTRGIFAGGTNVIDYITIGSTGDATDFGDLDASKAQLASVASSTRGVFSGGNTDAISIEYITIANTGNTTDFGDLDSARNQPFGSCSKTIGVFSGGLLSGSALSTAQQITIASTGNSTSFGTLTAARYYGDGASNAHGGI